MLDPFETSADPAGRPDGVGKPAGAAFRRGLRRARRRPGLSAAAAVVLAAAAVSAGYQESGWAAPALGCLAYASAVHAEFARRSRRGPPRRRIERLGSAALRLAAFWAAIAAAWLAARGLAAA